MFQISENKRNFIVDSQMTFLLADTCWSAFTNIEERDWEYYLDYRKEQGFNVIQVNMLQQWDASQTYLSNKPFAYSEEEMFDFQHYNEKYFKRAQRMVQIAYEKGITIALVLLWANYVPDTWASQIPIKQLGIFPKNEVCSYVNKVMSLMDQYHPIYLISGDTDFQTKEVIEDYYLAALRQVKLNNPHALTSLHIRGREDTLPEILKTSECLDFYMYQSGHNIQYQSMAYQLAETFYEMSPYRPIINSEPCYEMMGYSRRIYGRFSREDVRRTAWQSVLSGANSGITYGAHGIWSWHNDALDFDSSKGEAFETPFDWHDALRFKGAWDYSFIKRFIEEKQLFNLIPAQEFLVNHSPEIRCAKKDNRLIIYIPSSIHIHLKGDFSQFAGTYVNLETKETAGANIRYSKKEGISEIKMHRFTTDALLIIE
ncbi:DUF4038 domain-containing protein [Aerococcaceae bacterium zg-ZJ1578]|uniref:apiosidase-like domain-containing protein n=1 Tax=Aerococcaceae bacterium zg-252 TaxID=2796928 RepID=UPI001A1FC29B|nr:DUF4038 domain-containing protein [Aerococcaceae bacterium zg-1578]